MFQESSKLHYRELRETVYLREKVMGYGTFRIDIPGYKVGELLTFGRLN